MIFDSQTLKCIFDVIIQPEYNNIYNNIELEIVITGDNINIAANYGEMYYIKCCLATVEDSVHYKNITVSSDGVIKLLQIVNTWPDCKVKIDTNNDGNVSFEIIHNRMCLVKPVYVECVYRESKNDYILQPPQTEHDCIVGSKNLKHMLEFCEAMQGGVTLEIKDKNLLIECTNSEHKITTSIELDDLNEFGNIPTSKITLNAETCKLVVIFLRNFTTNKLVYLLFLDQEYAFSIKTYISSTIYYQIYTVHNRDLIN